MEEGGLVQRPKDLTQQAGFVGIGTFPRPMRAVGKLIIREALETIGEL